MPLNQQKQRTSKIDKSTESKK